jgi:hypothetical protein
VDVSLVLQIGLIVLVAISIAIGLINTRAVQDLDRRSTAQTGSIFTQLGELKLSIASNTVAVVDENKLARSVLDAIAATRSPVAIALQAQASLTQSGPSAPTATAPAPAAATSRPPPSSPRPTRGAPASAGAEVVPSAVAQAPALAQKAPLQAARPLPAVVAPPPRPPASARPPAPTERSAAASLAPGAPAVSSTTYRMIGGRRSREPLKMPELAPLTRRGERTVPEDEQGDVYARPTFVNEKVAAIPVKDPAPTLPPVSGLSAAGASAPPTQPDPDDGDRSSGDEHTRVWTNPPRALAAQSTALRLPFPELAGSADETPREGRRLTPTRLTPTQPSARAVVAPAPAPARDQGDEVPRRQTLAFKAFVAPAGSEKGSS